MSMHSTQIQELIRKYISGKCTPEENRMVENWYQSMEDDLDIMEILSDSEVKMLKTILFKNIEQQIRKQTFRTQQNRRLIWRYSVAAVVLLCLGVVWTYLLLRPNNSITTPNDLISWTNNEKFIEKKILPDGTIAWLHPNSILKYPIAFRPEDRTVTLMGEAFFEVTPDPHRPFLVYSGGIRTRVLGTSFIVRAYDSDPYAKVSVITGKVSVSRIVDTLADDNSKISDHTENEIVLAPEESALFSTAEQTIVKENEKENPDLAIWTKNSVAFDNVSLGEVLKTLNSVYHVKITVADKDLENYILRADFTGLNLPESLEILSHSFGLSYTWDDDLITLIRASPETINE